jgi:hypothetical protein
MRVHILVLSESKVKWWGVTNMVINAGMPQVAESC